MKRTVSVVVPTYNRLPMLREAIGSVLAQQCSAAIELIVVDDGSTDGTAEYLRDVIAAATRSAFRIVTDHVPHQGAAAARNRGAALASGAYLAFLDSDDLWTPRKLEAQLCYALSHPEYPLCQTQERWLRDGRRVNPGRRHLKRAGDIFAPSLRTCLISPSAVLMRTRLFHELGGFDERLRACEDYDLWLRILCRHEVGLVDEPLVIRRAGHPDQLSATVPAMDRYRVRALLKLLAQGELDGRGFLAVQVLADKCAILAQGMLRRGRPEHYRFYREVEQRARIMLEKADDPGIRYWSDALKCQPLELD